MSSRNGRRSLTKGRMPQWLVKHTHTEGATCKRPQRRATNLAEARKQANELMESSSVESIRIQGPDGSASFDRIAPGNYDTGWILTHSTLEEIPMPGMPEDL